MKNILAAGIFLTALALSSCDDYDYSFSNNDGKTMINIHDESGHLKLETRGEITFTDDETAIKSISDDGFVKFKKNGTRFSAKQNSSEILYTVNDGAQKTTLTQSEQRIVEGAIRAMINAGYDAKHREERIFARGGVDAVLKEVGNLQSDWVRSQYVEYLITGSPVTGADMRSVIKTIEDEVNGDYEKSKLLQKIPASYLSDDGVITAFINAVNAINSDYEKGNSLKVIVDQPLTAVEYDNALTAIGNISSDYDKANVLKQLISHGVPSEANTNTFLTITDGLGSDYEKGGVLSALLDKGVPAGVSYARFLQLAGDIGGDYDKSQVMKHVARAGLTSDDQWIALIQATEKIGGDYDRSDALVEIAKYMPKNERVKSAYLLTAKTITAEYNYGQAVKAVN